MTSPAMTSYQNSGLEQLRMIRDGALEPSPAMKLLGFTMTEVAAGEVVIRYQPKPEHANTSGCINGGVISGLADLFLGCAVYTMLPGDSPAPITTDLHVTFVRAVRQDDPALNGVGAVVHLGSKVAVAEGFLRDGRGSLVMRSTATFHLSASMQKVES